VAGAFDALAQWRDEISAANERCLTKAVDRLAAAQRAIGWPEHTIAAAREPLVKTAQVRTHMIDQIMAAWERQLKPGHDLAGIPGTAKPRASEPSPRAFSDPVSDMVRLSEMALVPFRLWVEAAEQWQRNWAALMSARTGAPRQGPDKSG
jgi:hypothetical protein